ncbi:hypothetical protein P4C99_15605 [Pontiellaceae bacterium B1224]|nr:hypothetical protein [Pontiellaceae bacterium B1224]
MKMERFSFNTLLLLAVLLQPVAGVFAATVEIPVVAPTRLQTLERKASEYERYKAQYTEIQQLLDDMLSLLPANGQEDVPTPKAGYGMLADLLEKAAKSDALAQELDKMQAEHERMLMQYDALKKEIEALRVEHEKVAETMRTWQAESEKWKTKAEGLRETIERLLLGEFEYYEVKEGDTLQGIAANPLVYGDPLRAAWLRQVNEKWVKHLDNLTAGEVLIIPRFPRDGAYEF